MKKNWFLIFLLMVTFLYTTPQIISANDTIGGVGETMSNMKTEIEPSAIQKLTESVEHNMISINFVWLLITGFLVMFMQAGFALVETGFCRAKNAAETMTMNFMVYAIGMIGYWICGYAFQMGGVGGYATLGGGAALSKQISITLFGKSFGLLGARGFFLSGVRYDAAIFAMFLFQMVFMDTAATIPTGSMAERWKFSNFCIFGLFMSMLIYPIYANWVWGGGWLSQLGTNLGLGNGFVDFAGSSVVHMVGGTAALAGAIILGPRIGKYNKDGTANAIPGHHIPMAIVGTFILAFGWFGFNAGSTLAGTDLSIALIAVNTMLASAAGTLSAMLYMWYTTKKPDPSMIANGMLAGLVAITAPCAFVSCISAVIIGAIAGILVIWSVYFVERVLKVDDPVGAVSVHGVNGLWGCLALGLFANGQYGAGLNGVEGAVRGLFYGNPSQFFVQLIGCIVCFSFVFSSFYVFFKVSEKVMGIRVSREVEIDGLDLPEVGILAYPDFRLTDLDLSEVRGGE
ncbi:MAG: ammonium transporter [bacterium]